MMYKMLGVNDFIHDFEEIVMFVVFFNIIMICGKLLQRIFIKFIRCCIKIVNNRVVSRYHSRS